MINEISLAQLLLNKTGISIVDAARIVLNLLDSWDKNVQVSPIEFCHRVIETGKRHIRAKEMSFLAGLTLYLETKQHLRPDSFKDIKYLSNRLLKRCPEFSKRHFSEFSVPDCEAWLAKTFATPSQFNKGRTMLHGLFAFAVRREWCHRNVVHLVERRKVIEKEIRPLTLEQTSRLLETSQTPKFRDCLAGAAIMILAGVRPREVRRMTWDDIDLSENVITVHSQCSKTGGVRHVEICPALKRFLRKTVSAPASPVCAPNWQSRWKSIRDKAGFKGQWIQDVLRHTYASFHAKCFRNLSRLQINMGHSNQNLLHSRYVNMANISCCDARCFFGC